MKRKKSPTQSQRGPSVTLYEDDLSEIIEILTNTCEKVTIQDDDYEYDSLAEVKEKQGKRLTHLSLTGQKPQVQLNIRIGQPTTTLEADGTDASLISLAKIKNILNRRKRAGLHFLFNPATTNSVLIFSFFFVLFSTESLWKAAIFLVIALVITVGLSSMTHNGAFSSIVLVRKHEQQSFWSRNRDSILVGVISGGSSCYFGLPCCVYCIQTRNKVDHSVHRLALSSIVG